MRITVKIATAGTAGISEFPIPNATVDECKDARGALDEAKVRKALACDGILFSSKDNLSVLAFCLEFLRQLHAVVHNMMKSRGETGDSKTTRCSRRMKRGYFAYVRIDARWVSDRVRVTMNVDDPKAVAGNTNEFAELFCEMCARILIYIKEAYDNHGSSELEYIEGKGCEGILEMAREVNAWYIEKERIIREVEECNARRGSCPQRIAGDFCRFCPEGGCRCFHNGYCKTAVVPPEYEAENAPGKKIKRGVV